MPVDGMTGRCVFITGGASGIGRAVALLAGERHAKVAVVDLDGDRAEQVADEVRERGATAAVGLACDVSNEADVRRALERSEQDFGVATAVFANAGIEINAPAHDLALADWHRVIEINLTGVFSTARLAIAALLRARQSGAVVCTSSPAAFVGFAGGGNAAYAASKGGLSALVRSLAVDYASSGIRVNAVVPGATMTPLMLVGVDDERRDAAWADLERQAHDQIPLQRMAAPVEVAHAVLWLLSDDASYVTGSHLVCDGGLLAKSANTI
jgi:NAD(P)-dependent dehydrogenase (short-subunit alcohol dehydrogenase family)